MKKSTSIDILEAAWGELYHNDDDKLLRAFLEEIELLRKKQKTQVKDPLWYKDAVVYSLYVDLFNHDFPGLINKLDYLQNLGVTCLWLLPILDSPMRDVGFDIRRYDRVRPELLGLPNDASDEEQQSAFREFLQEAHKRGLRVIFDIAMNHTSEEHEWFKQARSNPDSPYRDYYIWSSTDEKYKDARLLFKGLCPSNWEKCGDEYYFHRFYEFQPDLNYRNPNVLLAMCRNLLYWLGQGVDGFRADAIPFVWKEDETSCENLPKAHTIVRFFRAVLDHVKPGMLMLAEACQPPKDVVEYFGNGDECHAGYHFPLMPRIFIAMASESREPVVEILDESFTPPIPDSCQWFMFLRCHDELTLEMVTEDERVFINDHYLHDPRWTFREGEGIAARLTDLLEHNPQRIGLAYSIMLTLHGTPIIYYGDEFGRTNDEAYFNKMQQETGKADTRFFVRGNLDWDDLEKDMNNPDSLSAQVYARIKCLIATRSEHPCFGRGTLDWIEVKSTDNAPLPCVLAYNRIFEQDKVCVIQNLSSEEVEIVPPFPEIGEQDKDLLGQPILFNDASGSIKLPGYSYYWMRGNHSRGGIEAEWSLSYNEFTEESEGIREALCAVGNGYFGTRGAFEEANADGVSYPGTYIAGVYNRLTSKVGGRDVQNEDFVNCPNWLPVTFRISDGDWFKINSSNIVDFNRTLDFKTGLLCRSITVRDDKKRETRIESERFASMDNPHIAALRYTITPLNYSDKITIRSGLNGNIINSGVERYGQLESLHLDPVTVEGDGTKSQLVTKTNQSGIEIAESSRLTISLNNEIITPEISVKTDRASVYSSFSIDIEKDSSVCVEKVVSIFTSLDDNSAKALYQANTLLGKKEIFDELFQKSKSAWSAIWEKIDIEIKGDPLSQKLMRMHLFHSIVTASQYTASLDVGIPARGLHGEAYRGHIFWDELFILPFYNMQFPETAKASLLYRYNRLDKAREYAREYGYEGAMYPWQSGSNGGEETQVVHLNPVSGKWGDDYSSLQRHVSLAIQFSTWEYFHHTQDISFLENYGAEMFFEICRFWACKSEFNIQTGRFDIQKVMGPDEFHEKYADAEDGGLKNNGYTNIMVAWVMNKAFEILDILSDKSRSDIISKMNLTDDELEKWKALTTKLSVCISEEGIIEQYDGYFKLKELDWDAYKEKYGQTGRMDRLLKAEGKSADDYKVAKQADALMSFYLLSEKEVCEILAKLGYAAKEGLLRNNFDYYVKRTSHGSTLSRLVHAHLANLAGNSKLSWDLYMQALKSDYIDTQGGTTKEGIHSGVMAGTVYLALISYAGLDITGNILSITPNLPDAWKQISFSIEFKRDRYSFEVTSQGVKAKAEILGKSDVSLLICGKEHTLSDNEWSYFK